MFDYSGQLLCYCKHSQARFIQWLKDRYGTLDGLNRAWFRAYTDWSQVEPPRRFGTAADMIDWRRFWLDNLRRWLRGRVEAARRGAPNIPVQTHTAFSAYMGANNEGGLGNELGDEFLLARETDLFGLSSFPLWLMGEEHVYGHFLNTEIIAEAAREKPFYQVELQGGAGKAGLLGGFVPQAPDIRQWNWNVIASGGKGVVYWQYCVEPAGMESPGFGLVGYDGGDTPRAVSAGACARRFSAPLLDSARRCHAENAVYLSRNADLLCYAMGDEESYNHSFKGCWRMLEDAGIPSRFAHGDYAGDLLQEGAHTLYLPMALCLSEEERKNLLAFAAGGGRLIVEAGTGMYRENGELDPDQTFLRELFGMTGVFIEKSRGIRRAFETAPDGGSFETADYWQGFSGAAGDCRVLARFEDGAPAMVMRAYGKGSAVWIGGFAGKAYHENRDEGTRNSLSRLARPNGYAAIEAMESLGMTVRLLETDEKYLVVCLNRSDSPKRFYVRIAGREYAETVPARDGVLLEAAKA